MEKNKEDFFLQFVYQKPHGFDVPSHILANSIVNSLMDRGLSKEDAQRFIYSKLYRWAFDFGGLTESIEKAGKDFVESLSKEDVEADTLNDYGGKFKKVPDDYEFREQTKTIGKTQFYKE